ncbi:MAG TPA: F0F1 ATP synthase subunit delta [Candidatus Saccharimonadales bacterium]
MAQRLSRRKIADHAAGKLVSGVSSKKVLQEVAAYLVETGRTREMELIVRDIEAALAEKGIVVADVTSARPLSSSLKAEVAKLAGAKNVQLRETIDESVLGGMRVTVPGKRFDGTVRRKLTVLKSKAI